MDQKSTNGRMQKLTPLLLRLGVAAALISHGYGQFRPAGGSGGESLVGDQAVPVPAGDARLAELESTPSVPVPVSPGAAAPDARLNVSDQGLQVQTDWTGLLGGAEVVTGIVMALGLATRLLSLGVLTTVGLASFGEQLGLADGTLATLVGSMPHADTPLSILLATAALVLLFSGCGCLGVDGRLFGRRDTAVDLTKP